MYGNVKRLRESRIKVVVRITMVTASPHDVFPYEKKRTREERTFCWNLNLHLPLDLTDSSIEKQ